MNDKKGTDGKLLSNFKRTTWFGSLLRKTSIDELPNLINVLKGDMSIIGPRPLLVEYLPLYSTEQKKRHLVRPGMSGLAQVKGRNTIDWNKKFTYDLLYINKISFVFDLKIIFLTFYEVFFNTKSVNKSKNETNEKFNGKN
jgi:lipopolysaccharide/colanic/teichoic acid biosynthesis glycosyltransferase